MRDIIWTVIIIWVIWRVIEAFRTISSASNKARTGSDNSQTYTKNYTQNQQNTHPKKGELKSDAGEYVDYEEIK